MYYDYIDIKLYSKKKKCLKHFHKVKNQKRLVNKKKNNTNKWIGELTPMSSNGLKLRLLM